jgi:hypothetical protein
LSLVTTVGVVRFSAFVTAKPCSVISKFYRWKLSTKSGDTGGGLVATQWVFHGIHTGPLMDGTPATGRTVAYPGLLSFGSRAIRFAMSASTPTGRRWLSN